MASLEGRAVEVFVPLSLERRLRAHLHRLNASTLAAGVDLSFDPRDDLDFEAVLISAAGFGVREWESEDGVAYDEFTGRPLDAVADYQ